MNENRSLAHIEEIASLSPIDGADKIVLARVLGWNVVVKKDDFKVGDKVVYIEIDSRVPNTKYFNFLADRKFKVKTIKLRGQISQGLVVPLDVLPETKKRSLGDDVTEELGVIPICKDTQDLEEANAKKFAWWRRTAINMLRPFARYSGPRWLLQKLTTRKTRVFPLWVTKTDEDRIQVINWTRAGDLNKYNLVYATVTEKVDGSSATFTINKREFAICSRNLRTKSGVWRHIADTLNMKGVLKILQKKFDAPIVTIQGEIISPSIQKNRYAVIEPKFYLFNLIFKEKDGTEYHYSVEDFLRIKESTPSLAHIETVPLIRGVDKEEILKLVQSHSDSDIDKVLELATATSKLYNVEREGIVIRFYSDRKVGAPVSMKAISNKYLLKFDSDDEQQ